MEEKKTTIKKTCPKCEEMKPLDEFYKDKSRKDGRYCYCKDCSREHAKSYRKNNYKKLAERHNKYEEEHHKELSKYRREYYEKTGREKRGSKSMHENKLCSAYLGIVIGERLCRHLFKDVEVMTYGFPDYDIICNKGKKIDVKTACIALAKNSKNPHFQFRIKQNKIADFFICVAFDNVEDLNPIHMWMIPGNEINHKKNHAIRLSTIHKWNKWKRDIKDAQLCFTEMKN